MFLQTARTEHGIHGGEDLLLTSPDPDGSTPEAEEVPPEENTVVVVDPGFETEWRSVLSELVDVPVRGARLGSGPEPDVSNRLVADNRSDPDTDNGTDSAWNNDNGLAPDNSIDPDTVKGKTPDPGNTNDPDTEMGNISDPENGNEPDPDNSSDTGNRDEVGPAPDSGDALEAEATYSVSLLYSWDDPLKRDELLLLVLFELSCVVTVVCEGTMGGDGRCV